MKKLAEKSKRLHIKIEYALYKKLVKKVGDIPISAYIRRLIKKDIS